MGQQQRLTQCSYCHTFTLCNVFSYFKDVIGSNVEYERIEIEHILCPVCSDYGFYHIDHPVELVHLSMAIAKAFNGLFDKLGELEERLTEKSGPSILERFNGRESPAASESHHPTEGL